MALKYVLKNSNQDINKAGDVSAQVYFQIRDDAGVGKLSDGIDDNVQFVPGFPQTKASWKTDAEAAITAKYPGATEE